MKKPNWPTDSQILKIDSIHGAKSKLARILRVTPGAVSGRIRKIKGRYRCTYCDRLVSDYRVKLCRSCSRPSIQNQCKCGAAIKKPRTKCYKCFADSMVSFFPLHYDGYPSDANLLLISQIPYGQAALAKRRGVSRQRIHQKMLKARQAAY